MIVYTGAERNAGTSSDVTIRLIGNNGTTEPHILKSKSDCQNDFLSDKVFKEYDYPPRSDFQRYQV